MELREALEWSKKKWEFAVESGGKYNSELLIERYPEIAHFNSYCALCELFSKQIGCFGCPLRDIESFLCCIEFNRYINTYRSKDKLKAAEEIVKRIENEIQRLDDSQELYEEAL